MSDSTNGRFVWHELLTTDTAAAAKFFGKAIGWKAKPWGDDGSYTILMNGKRQVGGLMLLPEDARKMGAVPHWMPYVGTGNVDDTVRHALSLGGRVVKAAADIPNAGRFAILGDPQGAMFGVYTAPSPHDPATIDADFSWHELATTDAVGALAFYKKLFGWEETSSMDMGPDLGTYHMFGWQGKPGGGIFKKGPQMPGPAAWLSYILVKDAKQSAPGIAAGGGKVVNGPMEVPGGDWITQAMDPQGAMFAVHSVAPKAAPAAAKPAAKPAKKAAKAKPAKKAAKKVAKKAAAKSVKKSAKKAPKKTAKKATKKGKGKRR